MPFSTLRIWMLFGFMAAILVSCDKDDYPGVNDFVVAFENPSENFSGDEVSKAIPLVFSREAPQDGTIRLSFTSSNLRYGSSADFTTLPEAIEGIITIPVKSGDRGAEFTLEKWAEVLPGETKNIQFDLVGLDFNDLYAHTQGNSSMVVSLSESAALGGVMRPNVGGPNQPNQVYLSLRTKQSTERRRDLWDFGFYSGPDFHVKLNSSLYMFARPLEAHDIDAVTESQVSDLKMSMNFLIEGSQHFVDHPSGDLNRMVIHSVSENDEENPVYLVKMGNEIGTDVPVAGSVAVAGADRGWKKVRVLRRDNAYLFQYADLNSNSHREVLISKNELYNFTFFSLTTNSVVAIEPEQSQWDLNFTVGIEIENLPQGGLTAYGYSDFVKTNTLGNVKAYRVSTSEGTYEAFVENQIDENRFQLDQRVIGSSWRKNLPPERELFTNIFYVLKDSEENYYKLRFTALENENGLRGYPEFEFTLLK